MVSMSLQASWIFRDSFFSLRPISSILQRIVYNEASSAILPEGMLQIRSLLRCVAYYLCVGQRNAGNVAG